MYNVCHRYVIYDLALPQVVSFVTINPTSNLLASLTCYFLPDRACYSRPVIQSTDSRDREIILAIFRAGKRLGFQLRPRQQEVVLAFMKG